VFHAWQKNNLRQRFAANCAEIGRKVFRLLDAIDFVASRASKFHDQLAAVGDLLWACCIQMNA